LSKSRSAAWTTIWTWVPGHDRYIQTHHPATEASFFREQAAFFHAKDCGEILNLFVLHDAPLSFDVGEDVAGHVAPQQLQFRHELVLSPTPLKTKLCDIRPMTLSSWRIRTFNGYGGLHGSEQQEGPG
jgi:hypothetical protein